MIIPKESSSNETPTFYREYLFDQNNEGINELDQSNENIVNIENENNESNKSDENNENRNKYIINVENNENGKNERNENYENDENIDNKSHENIVIIENENYEQNYENNENIENNALNIHLIDNIYNTQKCPKKLLLKIYLIIISLIALIAIIIYIYYNESHKNSEDSTKIKKDIFDEPFVLKHKILESQKETKVGAHYKAFSQVIIGDSKTKTLVKLPDSINTNCGDRNGYISCGVCGENDSINVGLLGDGIGWTPFYYFHKTQFMYCFKEYKTNEDIKFINIEIEVTAKGELLAYFGFRNSTLFLLNSLNFKMNISHILNFENGEAKYKFFRFASLVPRGEDDQNDGTFIENGKFIGLTIIRNNKTESWGIAGNNIEDSWKISFKRIQVEYDSYEEKFSIIHRNNSSF